MLNGLIYRRMNRNPALPRSLLIGLIFFAAALVAVLAATSPSRMLLTGAVLALPLALAIFLKPEIGGLLLIFATYTRLFEVILFENEGTLSPYTAYLGLLVAILLTRWILLDERPKGWKPAVFLFGTFGLMILASSLYAAYPETTLRELIIFVKDAIMAILVVVMVRRAKTVYRAIWVLLAAGIFLGTITVFQQLTGSFDNTFWGFGEARVQNILLEVQGARVGGPGLDPNTYGQYMLILIPLAWDRMLNEKRLWAKLLGGWAFTVCSLTIIFSFSRGNFIGLVFVLLLLLVQRPPRLTTLAAVILIGIVLLPLVPREFTERLVTLRYVLPEISGSGELPEFRQATREISFRGRLSENLVGLMMTRDHPIFGVGYGNFKENYQLYSRQLGLDPRREPRSAHNLYLEISSEFGILGLIWFVILQAVVFSGLWRARNIFLRLGIHDLSSISSAYMVSIAGLLFTSIFLHMVYPRYFWFVYALALAIPQPANEELDEMFFQTGLGELQSETALAPGVRASNLRDGEVGSIYA